MGALNQIIAIEKGIKSRAVSEITEAYKKVQKPDLFNGFAKTYQSNDDNGDHLPPEKKQVHHTADEMLRIVETSMGQLFDITARKDWSNQLAAADVVVDGRKLLEQVPVPYLLFLEKNLNDIRVMVDKFPILDHSDVWEKDYSSGIYRTEVTKTHRTKKVQRPLVLYNATPEHPAQTQLVTEDVIEGYWSTVKLSGAMAATERAKVVDRIDKLIVAVKQAREAANSITEATASPKAGEKVFGYILRGEDDGIPF